MSSRVQQERWAVLAVGLGWEIGLANALPWKLPADLARFRRFTTPWPIIMGRHTWESIGRPLPNRQNLVLSRTLDEAAAPGAVVVRTLDEAWTRTAESERVMVIGGAHLYQQAIPVCTHIHLTIVQGDFVADTHLPLDLSGWQIISRTHFAADESNPWPQTVCHFERQGTVASGLIPARVPAQWYGAPPEPTS